MSFGRYNYDTKRIYIVGVAAYDNPFKIASQTPSLGPCSFALGPYFKLFKKMLAFSKALWYYI